MRVVRNMAFAVVSVLLLVTALVGPGGGAAQAAAAEGKLTLVAGQVITATFSGTKLDKNRQVSLDKSTDNGVTWTSIKTAKMSSKGAVNFGVVATDPGQYRAVAKAFTYKVKKKKVTAEAVVSPTGGSPQRTSGTSSTRRRSRTSGAAARRSATRPAVAGARRR